MKTIIFLLFLAIGCCLDSFAGSVQTNEVTTRKISFVVNHDPTLIIARRKGGHKGGGGHRGRPAKGGGPALVC